MRRERGRELTELFACLGMVTCGSKVLGLSECGRHRIERGRGELRLLIGDLSPRDREGSALEGALERGQRFVVERAWRLAQRDAGGLEGALGCRRGVHQGDRQDDRPPSLGLDSDR
jgi:hypothetical protein